MNLEKYVLILISCVLLWKCGFIWAEKSVFYHNKGVHFGLKSQVFCRKKGVIFKLENKDGYHFFQWVRDWQTSHFEVHCTSRDYYDTINKSLLVRREWWGNPRWRLFRGTYGLMCVPNFTKIGVFKANYAKLWYGGVFYLKFRETPPKRGINWHCILSFPEICQLSIVFNESVIVHYYRMTLEKVFFEIVQTDKLFLYYELVNI